MTQKLDEEELEEIREAFNLFDTDGNGTIAPPLAVCTAPCLTVCARVDAQAQST